MVKFRFGLELRGAVSLDRWFSKSLPEMAHGKEDQPQRTQRAQRVVVSLCVLCALCGFPNPFRKIIKNPLNQAGDDPARSREKFEQAFMEAFGRTGNGSAKPKGRLQQMLQRIMLWRRRIG